MNTENKARRVSSPLIKKILSEASPIKRIQNKNRVELACRIDDLIKAKGYTYSTFATKVEKQPSVITKWLSGTHNFTIDTLDEIAFHLGVETAYFMQPQPVKVIYRTRIEMVTKLVEADNPFRNHSFDHDCSTNWGLSLTVGMPYGSSEEFNA